MGITVTVEEFPEIGEWIALTLCDHSEVGMLEGAMALVFGQRTIDEVRSCNPTAAPLHPSMFQLMVESIEKAMPQVNDEQSVELWLGEPGLDPEQDMPKIRIMMGIAIGLIIEVRVDGDIHKDMTNEVDANDHRQVIRGDLPWSSVPTFVGSVREELAVFKAKHPDGPPDDLVGAEA